MAFCATFCSESSFGSIRHSWAIVFGKWVSDAELDLSSVVELLSLRLNRDLVIDDEVVDDTDEMSLLPMAEYSEYSSET